MPTEIGIIAMSHIVVVGAGQAGQSLVTKLRALGFEGELTLVGDEPVPPYQRPPLSKKYLMGEMDVERLYLRPRSFYDEQNITMRLGQPVTNLDRTARTIQVGEEVISYDQLALTTGSIPRSLPAAIGGELAGVYTVRTLADVDHMASEFKPGKRILIVGGGYIGLEAAAVAAGLGLDVTLVEMADRILQRVAAPETSDHMRTQHKEAGVNVIEGVGLDRLTGDDRVTGAILSDGSEIPFEFVIVGVGITPDTRLAEAGGLVLDNGIHTDAFGRTSDAYIWAAGDCASFPHNEGRIRLESVGNAIDQAEIVAENMLGGSKEYAAKPWFWSDQFDVKLQIAGLNTGYDRVITREGEKEDATSFWYFKGDQLLAVDAINDPRAYMVGKRLIELGKSPDADAIADPKTVLKALLKA
jgi:3-phenylpropionate/trans-cinnamate dioxygenase ferredoxin reductase subunit